LHEAHEEIMVAVTGRAGR